MSQRTRRRIAVLGSTGSIGTNTLDVAAALPDRIEVVGLSAHASWEALCRQAHAFRPARVALADP